MAETTKAVLDMMKADAAKRGVSMEPPAGGYAKAATPAPRIPVKPVSGSVDELLNLHAVDERARQYKLQEATEEQIAEWRTRVAAAPAKIAAAKAGGADDKAVKAAEAKVAEMQDRLDEALLTAARWYLLNAAYSIMRDFREKAGNGLREIAQDGGTLVFDVPGVLTFRADLAGPDDEIPF